MFYGGESKALQGQSRKRWASSGKSFDGPSKCLNNTHYKDQNVKSDGFSRP
jgi:hypothetical protein